MPLDKSLRRVMIIGSGPIVIGQAAEFDYAGTQACEALRALGVEVILVNSNPATIMTDGEVADKVYAEPLTLGILKRLIEKERPDGLLSTIGGQNGLTLSMKLARGGWLASRGVRLLGASAETIDMAEDRLKFKETLQSLGEPVVPSRTASSVAEAAEAAAWIGYPVIVRPSFTLGGTGGGIADARPELERIARRGLEASPVGRVLVEKSVAGWKEIEFEVMRDSRGNRVAVCSMENVDPAGVHTGDSIVVSPALTLADREYQTLRSAALRIVDALGVRGGCNVQFALDPGSFRYAVIEVNPRVSRSSALASKATGYPIAKVAAQLAAGLRLDEIANAVTGATTAFFEPALDYVVVKMPRWPFDAIETASRTLGPQMKSTGEAMAVAPTFEEALMKAVRGAETGADTLCLPRLGALGAAEIERLLREPSDLRLFAVAEALRRGMEIGRIRDFTKIDPWFLSRIAGLCEIERDLEAARGALSPGLCRRARRAGYPDAAIERLSGARVPCRPAPVYRMVDTCAAEFPAETPYFYSAASAGAGARDEASEFVARGPKRPRGTVVVLGGGPIRIGQGIEFDYAAVRGVRAFKRLGCSVVMINNNPETVSTDFDTADRLYFEPLTLGDVMDVIRVERPLGVVTAFGGQTAVGLTRALSDNGVAVVGTGAGAVEAAEDREKFDSVLARCGIARPPGRAARTAREALDAARGVGYPVLVRPSYVLGGRDMIVARCEAELARGMERILARGADGPVLIDSYVEGAEVEVDAVCDGEDVLIPGVMEHVERAGVHSGDSIAAYPPRALTADVTEQIARSTLKIAREIGALGLINIQYVVRGGRVFVIECNPRASRTVPFISKATGLPLVDIASCVMLRSVDSSAPRLRDLPWGTGLYRPRPYSAVKTPVFSFDKLPGADVFLAPRMKSTGEAIGVGASYGEALYKGFLAAGYDMRVPSGVFFDVRTDDLPRAAAVARAFAALGCALYAGGGTASYLRGRGIDAAPANVAETLALLDARRVRCVVCTRYSGGGARIVTAGAVERGAVCLTCVDTAAAFASALASGFDETNVTLVDIARLAKEPFPSGA